MSFSSRLVLGGLVGGAALAYYVRRKHRVTGAGYAQILLALPQDAQRWANATRERALAALEDGKAAMMERDAELTKQLTAAGAPSDLGV